MRRLLMAGLAVAALAPFGTNAAGAVDFVETGRYAFVPVEGGALRLDKESGEVSRCAEEDGRMLCRLVADDRTAYEDEIGRLGERLARLETRLETLEKAGQGDQTTGTVVDPSPEAEQRAEPAPPTEAPPSAELERKEEAELDRFLALTDKVMRRFFGMVQDLKRDFERDQL